MNRVFIIVFIIFILGCFRKRKVLETYGDGKLKIVEDHIDHNKYYEREYYENGKLLKEKVFINGLQDSIQTVFGEDGKRRAEINFRQGIRSGLTHELYSNGQIAFEGNCINGKFEGLSVWYYENGKVRESVYRHLGEDTGITLHYDTTGALLNK